MPYEEYDPDKNWVYENHVGRETGMGRGIAGSVGNAEYQQKLQNASAAGGIARPAGQSGAAATKPWFPAIDAWLARIPKWLYWLLGLVGALAGYGYGLEAAWAEPWVGALVGGFAGLLLLPLCAVALKLVFTAIILGIIVGVGYVALTLFGAI